MTDIGCRDNRVSETRVVYSRSSRTAAAEVDMKMRL